MWAREKMTNLAAPHPLRAQAPVLQALLILLVVAIQSSVNGVLAIERLVLRTVETLAAHRSEIADDVVARLETLVRLAGGYHDSGALVAENIRQRHGPPAVPHRYVGVAHATGFPLYVNFVAT